MLEPSALMAVIVVCIQSYIPSLQTPLLLRLVNDQLKGLRPVTYSRHEFKRGELMNSFFVSAFLVSKNTIVWATLVLYSEKPQKLVHMIRESGPFQMGNCKRLSPKKVFIILQSRCFSTWKRSTNKTLLVECVERLIRISSELSDDTVRTWKKMIEMYLLIVFWKSWRYMFQGGIRRASFTANVSGRESAERASASLLKLCLTTHARA